MTTEWQFLVRLNERLSPLKNPVQIQDVAVRLIGEHLEASRVDYAQIEGNEFVIRRSYARGVQPSAGRVPVARLGQSLADACRRGETVVVVDLHADPRFADAERTELLATGIAAFVEVPLIKDGQLQLDMNDDVVGPSCVTHNGEVVNQRVAAALQAQPG